MQEERDYWIPTYNRESRSLTVVLYSRRSAKRFSNIVRKIQKILCHSRNEWIVYFQSEWFDEKGLEEKEFIRWIYRDKIVTTEEYVGVIRELMEQSRSAVTIHEDWRIEKS